MDAEALDKQLMELYHSENVFEQVYDSEDPFLYRDNEIIDIGMAEGANFGNAADKYKNN